MKTALINDTSARLLENAGSIHTFAPGQTIYFEQDTGNTFFYIKKGRVRAYSIDENGREFTYEVIGPGRLFGTTDPFLETARSTSIDAVTEAVVVELSLANILPLLKESTDLAIDIINLLSRSVDALAKHIRRLTLMDAKKRIADFLLDISGAPDPSLGTTLHSIPYSHQDIADCCALQRVTVTRALHELEHLDLIRLSYRKVIIKDRAALERYARSV